jgi:hypothetical protein
MFLSGGTARTSSSSSRISKTRLAFAYPSLEAAAYWRRRFKESPALELIDLRVDGGAVVVTYRTNTGIVEALLDIADDGLITCCCCGPVKAFT